MKNYRHYIIAFAFITFSIHSLSAQDIGFHAGMIHPFITFSEGESTSIADDYSVGFPLGITFPVNDNVAFDAEFVPFYNDKFDNLIIHPGVLFALGSGYTFGTRLAYETGPNSYGFTPLLNKGFPIGDNAKFFLELVLPVRFGKVDIIGAESQSYSAYTIGLHVGVAF